MASAPATPNGSTPKFQPFFNRVQQSNDFDCAFACIAMLAGKTLEEVRQLAIAKFRHPKHGPYWITQELITTLLMQYGLVGTVYKEASGIASLPDVAIGMVEYNAETEIGRHVVFHRIPPSGTAKTATEYIIDPAYWVEPHQQVRTDIKGFPVYWYIGVHPVSKPGANAGK